jgi:hypothetical protein
MHDDDAPVPVTDRRPPTVARLLGLGRTRNPDDPTTPAYGIDASGDDEARQLQATAPEQLVPEQLAAPPERRGVTSGPNGAVVLAMLPLAANAGPVAIPRVPGQLVRVTLWTAAAGGTATPSGVWIGNAGYGNPVSAGVQLVDGTPLQLTVAGALVAGTGGAAGTLYIASEVLVP